ncbi:hypothetical protein ERJ75_001589400 [Trypanosoma vivax]|nr:hypothetical protein ERJ75_001589400 [Trypanosoma vivax]
MVVDENVVVVFACCTLAEPPRKMAKSELVDANVGKGSALALHPMHQTYCSEDIPVRDVVLFDFLIPSALAVLLESGALLVLDAITMEPLATRSLPRLFPPQGGKTKRVQGEKGTGAGGTTWMPMPAACFASGSEKNPWQCVLWSTTRRSLYAPRDPKHGAA